MVRLSHQQRTCINGNATFSLSSPHYDGARLTLLLGWMLVPLVMTLYFSFKKYLPLRGGDLGWVGFDNYVRFVTSSAFWPSVSATLMIVGGVLAITITLGVLLALLLDQPIWGQGIVRILMIAPFFSSCLPYQPWFGKICLWIQTMGYSRICGNFWGRTYSMDVPGIFAIDHYDRQLAMVAVRNVDPVDRNPIVGQRTA